MFVLTSLAQQPSVPGQTFALERLVAVAVLAARQRLASAAGGPGPAQAAAALARRLAEPARRVAV